MGNKSSHATVDFTFDALCQGLEEGKFKNVIIMCGAGVSTNAGIPDFRSPSLGLYKKLQKYHLPYPEAVFEGSYFKRNPKPFYGLVREIYPRYLKPTTTHKFFKLLDNKGVLLRVYTQNIDALEFMAGLPEDKVVEAHGTFHRSYCTKCKKTYDLPWLKKEIFSPETNDGVPKCEKCGGVVRPDVVLFGEALPSRFYSCARQDFPKCDLLMVFGTSLVVAPFNTLANKPKSGVPRVYVNKSKPGHVGWVGWFMGMRGGSIHFDKKTDLVLKDDCDKVTEGICSKAGWTGELHSIKVQVLKD